ncbi:MAG TPA: hypothetical protein VFO65_12475, partial [Acidimicrobiales bacterium]|nr:hypothetical protein [Acidimicrobiales bacterium]
MTVADVDPARAAAGAPRGPEPDRLAERTPGGRGSRPRSARGTGRTLGIIGAALVGLCALTALLAPVVARYGPTERSGRPFERPSAAHPLGTNDVGHDLFSQLVHG